ncbi:amidohydrolase family protein [Nocardioidaceae bacterium]|nr:amidohydrolase family protein [Nocardioidaceae bacterium]
MRFPAHVIDPHIHQWDPFTTPRVVSKEARLLRPLPRVPRAARWLLPLADREFAGDPHHLLRPYLPADYLSDTRGTGRGGDSAGAVPVGTVVHVEASWDAAGPFETVEETRWVASLPWERDGAPRLGGIVVAVDPRSEEAGAVLDAHLDASPLVRGVRFKTTHHPDPGVRDFTDTAGLLADPTLRDGFAAVAERGLSSELWCYAHQLPDALPLVDAYPETTFVLDHHGTPAGVLGPVGAGTGRDARRRRGLLERWRDAVAALGARPNVVAKQSGLGMGALGSPTGEVARPRTVGSAAYDALLEAAAPLVRHTHDVFGSDRTMWASNFPVDKPRMTLPATVRIVLDALGADADPQALLHDVAVRVYRLDTGPPD